MHLQHNTAIFRFYEELNDFLPSDKRKLQFNYIFTGNPAIKDAIEALGVPHTEVDLILVNGKSISFSYRLQEDDQVSVYPVFESLDISTLIHLRPKPLRQPKFILDVHLGKLARYLRLLGFDVLYSNSYQDAEICQIAYKQQRIVLTRDIGLLKNAIITRGYWLRATDPKLQIKEIIKRFDLATQVQPFTRCLKCNGQLLVVDKNLIHLSLPNNVEHHYKKFYQCNQCKKVYWAGSHYQKLKKTVYGFLGKHS